MRRGSSLILLGILALAGTSRAVAQGATAAMTAINLAFAAVFLLWGASARYTSRRWSGFP
jgi:hypothetical protein